MKKTICMMMCLMLAAACLAPAALGEAKKISIVTTIFPLYDWTREVVGEKENAELTLLLDSGVDLHSYQPTAADIMKIATCDVFIYVGGESDEWVEDALKEATNSNMMVVSLVEAMGDDIRMEETVEGMESDHDHEETEHAEDADHDHEETEHAEDADHDHEAAEHAEDADHDHDHGEEPDEHVWLSLRNARKLVKVIAEALGQADPADAARYQANAEAYAEKLSALDQAYAQAVEGAKTKTILFGDRFPFRYLTEDYGLSYYAAFSGCSAETEASFRTIAFLAQKTDELALPAVLTIEGTNHKIAETVIGATAAKNQALLTLDSMQGTTKQDVEAGVTYLGVMEKNLEVLKQAIQ